MLTLDNRIRSRPLQGVMQNWRDAILPHGNLPNVVSFHVIVKQHAPSSFLAMVEPDGFRFVRVGERLTQRLGRALEGELLSDDAIELFGSLKSTYQRCVEQGAPCYEYLRCDFGDGQSEWFERLTLPFSDKQDGVSHIGGTVSFGDLESTH